MADAKRQALQQEGGDSTNTRDYKTKEAHQESRGTQLSRRGARTAQSLACDTAAATKAARGCARASNTIMFMLFQIIQIRRRAAVLCSTPWGRGIDATRAYKLCGGDARGQTCPQNAATQGHSKKRWSRSSSASGQKG